MTREEDRVTRFRALAFPESRLREFLRSGKGLTAWYNEVAIGGQDAMFGGWFLVALGVASIIGGGVALAVRNKVRSKCEECDSDIDETGPTVVAALCFSFAILELLPGIPLAVWGTHQVRRWVKGDLYDKAPIEHLQEIRRLSQAAGRTIARIGPADTRSPGRPSLSITPYLAPGGGGLSFSLRY